MKRTTLLLALLVSGAFFSSCDHLSHESGHHASAGMPDLDHGKRWRADASTREGFAKLRATVPAVVNPSDGVDAYNARAARIVQDIDAVFAACKMTGAGHTELHKFIALLLEDLRPMQGSDLSAARKAQQKLSVDLDQFGVYFE